jgi:hypothetical protein
MFLLLLVALAEAATPTVKDCSSGTSVFTVNAASLVPADPIPGQNVTLHLEYTVPPGVTVTGGQSTFAITYNFIPLSPTVEPLCQDIPCPLGPGSYSNNTVSMWPSGLSGTVVSTLKWQDTDAKQLLCISITAKMMKSTSPPKR